MFLEEIPKSEVEVVRLRQPKTFNSYSKKSFGSSDGGYEEPSIALDDMGEKVKKEMPSSFLRNIDEL